MSNHKYKIAVMIPSRARTTPLLNSTRTLLERASHLDQIQVFYAFDRDDEVGINFWKSEVRPYLESIGVEHKALSFHPQGYAGLHIYYNSMAEKTDADWLMVWSDDALMETTGWDDVITAHDGEFTLIKVHTHREHPYSIFPIYPREWFDLFGYMSAHQMTDAELSQVAYMLDLITIVDITVTHDRYDLTGNNLDDTNKNRVMFEGNPSDPRDFHHIGHLQHRFKVAQTIAAHLRERGHDMTWWEAVLAGKQEPFQKMRENDINHQMVHGIPRP